MAKIGEGSSPWQHSLELDSASYNPTAEIIPEPSPRWAAIAQVSASASSWSSCTFPIFGGMTMATQLSPGEPRRGLYPQRDQVRGSAQPYHVAVRKIGLLNFPVFLAERLKGATGQALHFNRIGPRERSAFAAVLAGTRPQAAIAVAAHAKAKPVMHSGRRLIRAGPHSLEATNPAAYPHP